ncbi:UDP-N-acetylglucosamine 2-epimerase (hydrolyzing) [Dechloromonas sp. TW-R-39-2]|uniref:UDP-N-acetylglucosamine 2-epimerase n=1 Tax=Dechloromonas sp. TW-R-39-2 TaxID=2654218 RepID=UPI00193C935D|nr:UDP-N-acetylglucosamine 2-epimerase [Dechloromonas sp. TW-R-39-2]QRM20160.1 UDP-N-acetylglucosamine 2-epimerase (hydrolyzing) [Dechloromonas sp. TW-R-39-2]
MRRICVVTGTRAEYGLLRWLMQDIEADPCLSLQVIATCMHLAPEFGDTYREIELDGFIIDRKVEMLLSGDSPSAIGKSIGLGVIGFADAFQSLTPDLVIVLGDRFEILAAVSAALVARIPVAHLHGGELTEGAVDDAIRHAVTKMSHVHFVATEAYRQRVIQLGESPERVICVGGLGVDAIMRQPLISREALEASLDFQFRQRNLLVTFHPATLDTASPAAQMAELLAALAPLDNVGLIFTLPNADAGGRELMRQVYAFVDGRSNAKVFVSLGQQRYLSCMALVDGVVGNSSSGLLEAPSFRVGTVNLGSRQHGREQASSVINCEVERGAITDAIATLFSTEYRSSLYNVHNPYGNGGASARIVAEIKQLELDKLVKKTFFDLPAASGGGAT